MKRPMPLVALLQEHFDSVQSIIESGRWGHWILDHARAAQGQLALTHEHAAYLVPVCAPGNWVAQVAAKDWASAEDLRQLALAIRDLEYARWLGLVPAGREQSRMPDGPTSRPRAALVAAAG